VRMVLTGGLGSGDVHMRFFPQSYQTPGGAPGLPWDRRPKDQCGLPSRLSSPSLPGRHRAIRPSTLAFHALHRGHAVGDCGLFMVPPHLLRQMALGQLPCWSRKRPEGQSQFDDPASCFNSAGSGRVTEFTADGSSRSLKYSTLPLGRGISSAVSTNPLGTETK
jgi:hypothetical protein